MVTWLFSRRVGNLLGALTCFGMLGFGYFLQFVEQLEPCPLCIFQRVALLVLGGVFLLAALHHPRGIMRFGYACLVTAAAVGGGILSGRHIWIQYFLEDSANCGVADVGYLMETIGFSGMFLRIWQGTGDCAEIDWTFLNLSIPVWTLAAFVVLGLWGLSRNLKSA